MQERANRYIPGMTQLLSKRPDMFSLGVWPGYFSRAKGVHVWDLDGNRYVDMSIGGIGANVLGYADPDVDAAVSKAITLGTSCSLNCPEEVELAELLCELHPWAGKVRYARSGGEAMAVAVRIARAFTGKDKVAICGYHGWHDWYLAANLDSNDALNGHHIAGLSPVGVPRGLVNTVLPFRYNHLEELEAIVARHHSELAAIVMEPIRNFEPEPGFFKGVRALADETGSVLILDEISAGFRMTAGGAHLILFRERPDMAVFSKALGNGYPIAAVIGDVAVMEAAHATFISSTCWTERIGPTAALATVKKFEKVGAASHITKLGVMVREGWSELAAKHALSIRITGAMKPIAHFAFEAECGQEMKAYFVQLMLEQGFLASTLFYAMYTHKEEHVAEYLRAVDTAFGQIAEAAAQGTVRKKIEGKPPNVGFMRLA